MSAPKRQYALQYFGPWFKAQYGATPSMSRFERLQKERNRLATALHEVQCELTKENELQRAWTNALYGWNAGRDKK